MINKSDSRFAVVQFCYHSYDYRPNWTPLSPITIINHNYTKILESDCPSVALISTVIIKITISLIVIGFKNSYFPLIHLPSCYRTVQQTNQIQSCSLNQPITTLVSITIETVYKLLNLCILCQFF